MPNISRRAVLGATAGSAALTLLGVDAAPADAASSAPLVRAHYAGSVGRTFTARHNGRTCSVTLTAIRDAVPVRAKDRPYCFTLVFSPARGATLSEGIYRLTRRGVHTHDLFLSAVGTAGHLQAVVNRAAR